MMTAKDTDWLSDLEQKAKAAQDPITQEDVEWRDYRDATYPGTVLRLIGLVRLGRELVRIEEEPDLEHLGAFTQLRRQDWFRRKQTALAAFREADHE